MLDTKNTLDAGKRSAMVSKENTKVPAIKPNCTIAVMLAELPVIELPSSISSTTAFAANQREVPVNWANTIIVRRKDNLFWGMAKVNVQSPHHTFPLFFLLEDYNNRISNGGIRP